MATTKNKAATVEVETEQQPIVEKKRKEFKNTDPIECVSVTPGILNMNGIRSQMPYKWMNLGDKIEVEYGDLVAAYNAHSDFLFKPFFVINDEDFLDKFEELKGLYKDVQCMLSLSSIFSLPLDEMEKSIKSLPKGVLETVKTLASNKIVEGDLDSISRLRLLDSLLGTKFTATLQ